MSAAEKSLLLAPLDTKFRPTAQFIQQYRTSLERAGNGVPFALAMEHPDGAISHYKTVIRPNDSSPETLQYAERITKFLLWSRGAWRLHIAGPAVIVNHLRQVYSNVGARAFDCDIMTRSFGRPFEVVAAQNGVLPPEKSLANACGGFLDGCRLGFDLGASDYKVAAVKDGEVLFSDEYPWNPRDQKDPDYHFNHLMSGLKKAAAHLPRVDAIGGSSAGVIFDNKIRVASLLRSIPADRYEEASRLFLRVQAEWQVPLLTMNDGDVSALAGSLSLGTNGVLGLAFGSSLAGGYVDMEGHMRGWLTELAFAPVDENPVAPADEWSGDRGVGALYFSQQAVNKLLPAAGISCPDGMPLPERLLVVQDLMEKGDERAAQIYETIGVYLGSTLPLYTEFYDFRNVLLLGRVLTGKGGEIIIERSRKVYGKLDPKRAAQISIQVPDEKSRRVGQAVAAASLPKRS